MLRIIPLLAILIFFGCQPHLVRQDIPPIAAPAGNTPVKNIILVIGDGMALSQISAGMYWSKLERSVFRRFPVVGFHKSYASDDLVTDSAAGATAFSCGHKTFNGAIGVLPNKEKCPTILEQLSDDGYATGMVVTCSASHATPAAFIAHQDIRAFTEAIAAEYLNTPLDCFIGGGEDYFIRRPDQRNLEDSLRQRGYIVRRGTAFNKIPMDGSAPFMQFVSEREPPTASAGRSWLPKASRTAAEYLAKRGPNGFFLMVEGSQIDWALHANDRTWLRAEMTDFDKTLAGILDFAEQNGETLVIVTGDHECAGLALTYSENKKDFKPTFAKRMHTAAMVPVLAFGPQARRFSGIYENTAIYYKMWEALGQPKQATK
jgi:alkaline phosphatase